MRKKQLRQASTVIWCVILVVAIGAASFGVGGATSPHKTEKWPAMEEGTTFQNYTMYLYGDSSHAPGASEVSIWYEIIVHGLPDDNRRAWLNQSVTASPWVGACELNNLVHFGIDRGPDTDNGTGGGTTTYYQTQTEGQVTSVDTNYEKTWYGEEGVTNYRRFLGKNTNADEKHKEFPLSTSGWDAEFVQTSVSKFWDKQQAESDDGNRRSGQKTTFEYENMDRVIVDYQGCYTNPNESGWYRQASLSETYWVDQRNTAPKDKTVGAPGNQNYAPVTYSHWVYICECSSYDEAVNQLGAPPEMNGTKVENPENFAQYYGQSSTTATPTPGGGNATATPGGTTTTTGGAQTTTSGGGGVQTTSSGTVQTTTSSTVRGVQTTAGRNTRGGRTTQARRTTRAPGAQTTSGPSQQNAQATQTNNGGPGFGVIAALLALLAAALLARRR